MASESNVPKSDRVWPPNMSDDRRGHSLSFAGARGQMGCSPEGAAFGTSSHCGLGVR